MHRYTLPGKLSMAMHRCTYDSLMSAAHEGATNNTTATSFCALLIVSRGMALRTPCETATLPHVSAPYGLYRNHHYHYHYRSIGSNSNFHSTNNSTNSSSRSSSSMSRGSTALWCACRAASDAAARRPSYDEIAEALRVLGVSADVDVAALKRRYRELVKANHPDAGGSETKMAAITVAYDRLSGLSKYEWDAFRRQRRGGAAFRSSNPYNTNAYSSGSSGGGGGASYAYHNAYYGNAQQGFAGASPYYNRPGGMSAQDFYYNFARGGGGGGAAGPGRGGFWSYMRPGMRGGYDGAGGGAPFGANRAGFGPMGRHGGSLSGSYLLQGLVLYLFISTLFLFMYRSYRDWAHDDGWRMAESLARHEQMQELQRIRQELNERLRYGDGAAMSSSSSSSLTPSDDVRVAQAWPLAARAARSAEEQRNLLLARQRRLEQQAAEQQHLADLRGWPSIREEQGVIYRRAQDPVGVVVFEPSREAVRQRQLVSRQRELSQAYRAMEEGNKGNGSRTKNSTTKAADTATTTTGPSEAAKAANKAAQPTGAAPPMDSAALPPERSAGVVAIAVQNETEARAAVRSILHTLATAASPNDAHPFAAAAATNAEAKKA